MSRRGRASARRRGRAVAPGAPIGGAAGPAPGDPGARAVAGAGPGDPGARAVAGAGPGEPNPARLAGPRRSRAAHLRRRRSVLLAGMGALTLVGVGLAVTGLSNVRSSTAGRYEQVVGTDEPGHQAYVVPTPTMGVLHRDADGELVGASVLALEPGDDGGTVILVPPATVVPGAAGDATLADVYREQDAAAAAQSLGMVVTAAVTDHVEVDDDLWAQLVEPVGSVEVHLAAAIGPWDAGDVTLDPAEVGPFLAARDDAETDLARLDRQQAFWSAWLPLVESGGDDALPGEASTGMGRFVRGVAHGGAVIDLPVGREETDDGVRFVPDGGLLGDLVSGAVPYPTSPAPGARIRVRLLSGTGDPGQAAAAAQALVAGGAEIVIVGNAPSFDVAETTLVHTDADGATLAAWLQATAIAGRVEEAATAPPDEEIDVTVILGDDAGDLMRR